MSGWKPTIFLFWLGAGCTGTELVELGPDAEDPTLRPTGTTVEDDPPTWHQDVAPVIATNCGVCHGEGTIGVELMAYEAAYAYRALILDKVVSGEMPPFPASESDACPVIEPIINDRRLAPDDLDLIVRWIDGGALEGDPATAAAVAVPPTPSLARVDDVLLRPEPYEVPPSSEAADILMCFVLENNEEVGQFIEGYQIVPDNDLVVHHSVMFLADQYDAKFQDMEDGVNDNTYVCQDEEGKFELGFSGAVQLGVTGPGSVPVTFPKGSAIAFGREQALILNVHYHGAPDVQFDLTQVELQYTKEPPERPAEMRRWGNSLTSASGLHPGPNDATVPEFRIPAGASGHTETMSYEIVSEQDIFVAAPHMHLVGSASRAWVERADGQEDCIINVPRWDFDWQLFYQFDVDRGENIRMYPGDKLHMQCTYDNSLDNPRLVEALAEQGLSEPVDIEYGAGSLDEMCGMLLGTVPVLPAATDSPKKP